MNTQKIISAQNLLTQLNETHANLHKQYEKYFWISYMGDHSVDKKMVNAKKMRDDFQTDPVWLQKIEVATKNATKQEKKRLDYWKVFFNSYQTPKEVTALKNKIDQLEASILHKISKQKEGFIDPSTKKFVKASRNHMRTMVRTHDDEKVRKACFIALEKLAGNNIKEYIELVGLRNQFAKKLGYDDFYAYKLDKEEGMTKEELFKIFDEIYEKTKYVYKDIKNLEKEKPKIKYPWNFSYIMSGDFTKEDDPYFQFDEALIRWGKSFAALGIDFKASSLQLDLLDRKSKYSNGFCHWPEIITFKNGKRISGQANFTCNTIFGQVGSGIVGMETLFHEGGHAAHYLNIEMQDTCLNTEYPPSSTAWAETQSMFLDTMFSSIEWKTRYAKNANGETYPFELFERKLRRLNILAPLGLSGILFVANFEQKIYSAKKLTPKKVREIAHWSYKKYYRYSYNSLTALSVPHIYSWESACSYHGYGLAELAVAQWREYFYKKYGYIVDNPKIYKEMEKVWRLGAAESFQNLLKIATGKKLSAKPYLRSITKSLSGKLKTAKERIAYLQKVPKYNKKISLNASIKMVHGKKTIATNSSSFESMAEQYKRWLQTQKKM